MFEDFKFEILYKHLVMLEMDHWTEVKNSQVAYIFFFWAKRYA